MSRLPMRLLAAPPLQDRAARRLLWGLAALCAAVELTLQASDHGLIGSLRWRSLAYQNGGFWVGLLHDWTPNYRLQPVTMFFSYAILHAGLSHLIGNLLALFTLGEALRGRCSARGLGLILATSSLGGALVFGLLSNSTAPMVGASGAIFGLVGAWVVFDHRARRAEGRRGRLGLLLSGLALLNLGVWWMQQGGLAWETHLGGLLAGAALALYLPRFSKRR